MRRILLILFSLVLLAGGVGGLLWKQSRPPLKGDTLHDFGLITFSSARPKPVQLQHTLRLTNGSNKPVTIYGMRPDCGCLTVGGAGPAGFPITVEPDQTIEAPIRLTLSTPGSEAGGRRTVRITADFGDAGHQVILVRATGRYLSNLSGITLPFDESGTSLRLRLTAALFAHDRPGPPGTPTLDLPETHRTEFQDWKQTFVSRNAILVPDLWEGIVGIEIPDDPQAREWLSNPDSTVRVTVQNLGTAEIPLRRQAEFFSVSD